MIAFSNLAFSSVYSYLLRIIFSTTPKMSPWCSSQAGSMHCPCKRSECRSKYITTTGTTLFRFPLGCCCCRACMTYHILGVQNKQRKLTKRSLAYYCIQRWTSNHFKIYPSTSRTLFAFIIGFLSYLYTYIR